MGANRSHDQFINHHQMREMLKITGVKQADAAKLFSYSKGQFNHFLTGRRPSPFTFAKFQAVLVLDMQIRIEKLTRLTQNTLCQEG